MPMNFRRFASAFLSVLLFCSTGHAVSAHALDDVSPSGEFFASIKIAERATGPKSKGITGFVFYRVDVPGVVGPMLEGYQYADGELIDRISTGSVSKRVIEEIHAVGLRPFDFAAAVKASPQRLDTIVLDGAKIEIRVMTPQGELRLEQWNPGAIIDGHAPHNTDIGKLKNVLDILALYVGRSRMGI